MGELSPYEVLTGLRGRLPRRYLEASRMTRRAAIIVLDGVGIGEAPDAAAYGDVGSDTLGNLSRVRRRDAPAEPRAGRAWATSRRSPAFVRLRRPRARGA